MRSSASRPQRHSYDKAPHRRPSEPWVFGLPRWASLRQECAIDAKNGCSRGKQWTTLHTSGVVSRVPRGSRSAEAFGTNRNTYRTSSHQQEYLNGWHQRSYGGDKVDLRIRTTDDEAGTGRQGSRLGAAHAALFCLSGWTLSPPCCQWSSMSAHCCIIRARSAKCSAWL